MNSIIKKIKFKTCGYEERAKLLREMGVKIGDGCEIYPSVSFGSEPYLIELGDNVRLTAGVKITTHDGGLWVLRNLKGEKFKKADRFGKVKIGDNVHIGIGSIIMPGVTIGDNVVIGCSAVVTKDIPSNSVTVGVPAKVIESIDEYYEKVKDKVVFIKNMGSEEKKKYLEDGHVN